MTTVADRDIREREQNPANVALYEEIRALRIAFESAVKQGDDVVAKVMLENILTRVGSLKEKTTPVARRGLEALFLHDNVISTFLPREHLEKTLRLLCRMIIAAWGEASGNLERQYALAIGQCEPREHRGRTEARVVAALEIELRTFFKNNDDAVKPLRFFKLLSDQSHINEQIVSVMAHATIRTLGSAQLLDAMRDLVKKWAHKL